MPLFAVFDLFNTLVPGADEARVRILERMAEALDVAPAGLLRAYRESWPERLVGWGVEETVRVLSGRLGARPSDAQVATAAALRREYAAVALGGAPPSTVDTLDALRAEGYRLMHLPMGVTTGVLAGLCTQPATLVFAAEQSDNHLPELSYATVFPAAMLAKIFIAQILLVALA